MLLLTAPARLVRLLAATSAALLVAGSAVGPALAWDGDVEGKPDRLEAGGPVGWYFWHDDDGLHLRTAGPTSDRKSFDATLHTDGEFRGVRLIRLEGGDAFAVRDGGHTLAVHFNTYEGIDGVDFAVEGGSRLHLNLRQDGSLSATDEIYLGEDSSHPGDNPFVELR
jgi:hypothetical protein